MTIRQPDVSPSTGDGARRRRNPKGAGGRLRSDLVVAASRLLDLGGDAALTIRAVAREVGAAPQSVYLHFADREELLLAVLSERFDQLRQELDGAADQDGIDRLRARCLAYGSYGLQHPRRYRLLLDRGAPADLDRPAADFPGAPVLQGFLRDVRDVLLRSAPERPPSEEELFAATTDLLATLHGAVLFRTGLPSFPWPPFGSVVERALQNLVPPVSRVP